MSELVVINTQKFGSFNIGGNSNQDGNLTVTTPSGYKFVGLVGCGATHGDILISSCRKNGENSVYMSVRNGYSNSQTYDFYVDCLFIKNL